MRKAPRVEVGLGSEVETHVIALSICQLADMFVLAEAIYPKGVIAAI